MKKKHIKAVVCFCFYRVSFSEPNPWRDEKVRWCFKMLPRKWAIALLLIAISPFIIISIGVKGLIEVFPDSFKVQSWSSYEILLPEGIKPRKWDCYKKF